MEHPQALLQQEALQGPRVQDRGGLLPVPDRNLLQIVRQRGHPEPDAQGWETRGEASEVVFGFPLFVLRRFTEKQLIGYKKAEKTNKERSTKTKH